MSDYDSDEMDEMTGRRQADADGEFEERQIEEAVAPVRALAKRLAEALEHADFADCDGHCSYCGQHDAHEEDCMIGSALNAARDMRLI